MNKETNKKKEKSSQKAKIVPDTAFRAQGLLPKAVEQKPTKAKIVPDTSILIQGRLSELISTGKLKDAVILIPKIVVDELQSQASTGRDIGFSGLEEIKKIRKIGESKGIEIRFTGELPTFEEIQLAKKGRLDALIKDIARKEDAILLTADYIQALVGEVENVKVEHIPSEPLKKEFLLGKYFTKETQSVHLKVGTYPLAKRGRPGQVQLVRISKKKIEEKELKKIEEQIFSMSRVMDDSFFEIGRKGAAVVQLGEYRISITWPPFSDTMEITAVRPIAKLTLNDYKLHKELEGRIISRSSGILIAGPPGSGKSTFASSLGEFISSRGKIVKTFEQPRDLQVGPEITQYAPLEGDWEKTAEILLLVRPDYTIFDEVRKTRDFKVFVDMRLAGVGMIGVVHANDPVDAIQRFMGRVELGIIPHVVDTVIFIEAGKIKQVYELSLTVKVPTGMIEADLSRPVVEIRDFATKKLMYEVYTYGEENVIIPVKEARAPINELAKERVLQEIGRWDPKAEAEIVSNDRVVVKVRNDSIAQIIGRQGQNIESIEKKLGIHITVEPKEQTLKSEIPWRNEESGAHMIIRLPSEFAGSQVDLYNRSEYVLSSHVGKGGLIRIKKKSEVGRKVLQAIVTKGLRVLV